MEISFEKTRTDLQRERLRFALFVAAAFHAIIVFGIGFNILKSKPRGQTIEVTLAVHKTEQRPDEADFIAQANQQGSGNSHSADELTTDTLAENDAAEIYQQFQARQAQSVENMERQVITVSGDRDHRTIEPSPDDADSIPSATDQQNIQPQDLESLKARLAQQRNQYSKIPRTRRLTSVSAKSSSEASYLLYWIERAERIGNQNYPEEARRKRIYGELQLAVTIRPDGSVDNIEVIKSSGHRVLDLAAMRTVRLAAPFAPFTDEMREYDRYEIIRTWRYASNDQLVTSNH